MVEWEKARREKGEIQAQREIGGKNADKVCDWGLWGMCAKGQTGRVQGLKDDVDASQGRWDRRILQQEMNISWSLHGSGEKLGNNSFEIDGSYRNSNIGQV